MTRICKICGHDKAEPGWWAAIRTGATFQIYPLERSMDVEPEFYLCGQFCAMKEFDDYMTKVGNNGTASSTPQHG